MTQALVAAALPTAYNRRLVFIDKTRGIAMLFVFWSHFAEVYFGGNDAHLALLIARRIGMVASPTFMLLSGMMLGYLFTTKRTLFGPIRASFINRGIFLLTGGRLLIMLAHLPIAGGFERTIHWGFITDPIGISLIVAPLLITRTSTRGRWLCGIGILLISWLAYVVWQPGISPLQWLKSTFVGDNFGPSNFYFDNFPLLPWLAVYLIGTSIGEHMGTLLRQDSADLLRQFLVRIGLAAITAVILLRALHVALDQQRMFAEREAVLHFFTNVDKKLPPSPAYLLFYGGLGLLGVALALKWDAHPLFARATRFAMVFGQTSLFVFLLQYYMYFTVVYLLHLPMNWLWPVYFISTVVVLYAIACVWHHYDCGRYLTTHYWQIVKP